MFVHISVYIKLGFTMCIGVCVLVYTVVFIGVCWYMCFGVMHVSVCWSIFVLIYGLVRLYVLST